MPDKLQDTIADIYEAAVGDDFMDMLPDAISGLTGSRSSVVQHTDAMFSPLQLAYSWFSAEMVATYMYECIYEDDVWRNYAVERQIFDRTVNIGEIVGEERYRRSRFYQDFTRRYGDDTGRCLGAILRRPTGGFLLYGTHHAFRSGDFEQADVDRLERLNPHLLRGLALQEKIGADRHGFRHMRSIFDGIERPLLTVNPAGQVTVRNRAADAILARGDGLTLSAGRLVASLPSTNRRLGETIDGALKRSLGHGGSLLIERIGGRRPYRLTITPMPLDGLTHAMVLIDDPDAETVGMVQQLRELYGFTRAEAQAAILLGQGHSTEEIADLRQVSTATVKSLLHRCFRKSDTKRATQLVRLVNRLPR